MSGFSSAPAKMLPSDAPPPPVPAPPQPVDWQRLHPASPFLNAIIIASRAWPVFLVALINGGSPLVIAALLLLAASVMLALAFVRYLRFDYRLEGTTLVVRSGVFVRTTRTIPADRVQQVTRNEKLRHRLLGVAEVLVEVAGAGTEPDVSLSVVAQHEAERIRVRLHDARRAVGAAPPAPDRIAFEQPNDALLRWAAISSPLFMLPAAGAVIGALGDAVDIERAWGWLPDGSQLWFISVAGLLGLAGATAINVIRFYELRLVQTDDNLRLEYGLLTHRRLELPTDRVQAIVTKRSPAGRLSRTVGLTAHNASSGGDATNSYLPAVPLTEQPSLIGLLFPNVDISASIEGHPRPALRRSVFRWTRPVVLIVGIVWIALRTSWVPLLFLWLLPAGALGIRAWRVLGHGENDDVVLARRGAITDQTVAVRKDRVQSASVYANWFQRRLSLATMQIEVAQPLGRVVVRDMDATEAVVLATTLAEQARSERPGDQPNKHQEQQDPLEAGDLAPGDHGGGSQDHRGEHPPDSHSVEIGE